MTKARRERLQEAREWFPEQGFTDDSHIVKAYRKKFMVDKDCAMRELCLLGVLSSEKQKLYEDQLKAKARRREKKVATDEEPYQDENFAFIAGYTAGGAPYGIIWEEEEKTEYETAEELPF